MKTAIVAAAVLSGNRNFEGRISPDVQANYLASPPLVVAHALAGTVAKDLDTEPLGHDKKGNPVFLADIWPSDEEIDAVIEKFVTRKVFKERYADVFNGDVNWRKVKAPEGETYKWDMGSTYVQNPPYFVGPEDRAGAGQGNRERAHPRDLRRQDHDRSYFAGGLDQGGLAGGRLSARAPGLGGEFQPVRHAARQS